MDAQEFASIQAYVGFDARTSELLRELHPVAMPHFTTIIDDFYETIAAHPRARQVITGGQGQIDRLKRTLVGWLDSVLLGPHDLAYLEAHSRIGRVHVRIQLPQELMFTAMNRIRSRLVEIVHGFHDPARRVPIGLAVNQILDLELAIMLDTYREDWDAKNRNTERLATIGQLAASIGHELRNPLGIVESSVYLLQQRLKKMEVRDSQLDKHTDRITEQIKHCGKIIDNLLDLARDRAPRRRRFELHALLERAREQATPPAGIELEIDAPAALNVDADPDDLLRVIVNLIGNAVQALGGRGHIWISGRSGRGGIEIRVRDDGPGVAPEIRQRIFDALFTTRSRGTGLGLALCRRILYAHGGEIQLEPGAGGASFRVWLPDRESLRNGTAQET
jgi:two-component system sensor histidine kinase HydH